MATGHSSRLQFHLLRGDWRVRFWHYVEKGDGCWLWRGPMNSNGRYGMFTYDGRTRVAHRVSYFVANGEFDQALSLCHKCDNPKCVRPDHLFLGTHQENMQDAIKKGRFVYNPLHGHETHCPQGHPYSGHNLIVYNGKRGKQRMCRTCHYARIRAREKRRRTEKATA